MIINDKGVTCNCGLFHKFDAYYYAHTCYDLTVKCTCGNMCTVYDGEIIAEKLNGGNNEPINNLP